MHEDAWGNGGTAPRILTDWVGLVTTFYTCIQEVLGLNPGRHADYPDRGFTWNSLVVRGKFRKGHKRLLPNPFRFIK
jgi:hypothetical protein